jgi:hypothetical protein
MLLQRKMQKEMKWKKNSLKEILNLSYLAMFLNEVRKEEK